MMNISADGIDALKRREAPNGTPVLVCFADTQANGLPTGGWGTTGHGIEVGKEYQLAQWDAWFREGVQWAVDAVNAAVKVTLSQNQFDALVSMVYNCGVGKAGEADGIIVLRSGKPSTLLRLVNAGNHSAVPTEMLKWVHDAAYPPGGPGDPGLINRRNSEGGQYVKGQYVAGSGKGIRVAQSPTWWQQTQTKIGAAGTAIATSGIAGSAVTAAGQQVRDAAAGLPWHSVALLITVAGVAMIVGGAMLDMVRSKH